MKHSKFSQLLQHIIDHLRSIKIQSRLFIIFFFVSLVPILCIGLFSYGIYTKSINSKLGQSFEQATSLLNNNLVTELEKFKDYCSLLSVSPEIQDTLSIPPDKSFNLVAEQVRAFKDLISNTPFQSKYLKGVCIVDRDCNIQYDMGYDGISNEKFQSILTEIDKSSPKDSIEYIRTYRSYDKLVLGRKIYNQYNTDEHIGYILIYIDNRLLTENIFSNISFGTNSNIILINSNGNIISSQDTEKLGSSLKNTQLFRDILENRSKKVYNFNTTIDNKNYLVVYTYNSTNDNYLIATIPYSYITEETKYINIALFVLSLFLIVICFISAALVYISIINPIKNIIQFCNVSEDTELDKRIHDTSKDEIGYLANTINNMLNEIQLFTLNWKDEQRNKRELELAMLQCQINPHFLFNTLNTLKWIAVINDVPTLSEGISSLSALLQSTLMKKEALITIQDELNNLNHYFYIQKIRYADSFEVSSHIEEDILLYEIPRFILQPLAENAIIHAGNNSDIPIKIYVNAYFDTSEDIIIEIIDDGIGFDAKELIDKSKDCFNGIGINNVRERIHLHYGQKYGLTIHSTPNKGTTCTIHLPKGKMKEKIHND